MHELHTTMKTYQSYQGEAKQAEAKLKVAENQRLKIEQAVPKEKLEKSKKFRLIEKELQKVIIVVNFLIECIFNMFYCLLFILAKEQIF